MPSRRYDTDTMYRLLVQGVADYAIYMLDPDGTVANWNAGAQRAKGYTADEIVGKHFSCFYTPEDRADGLPWRGLATARAEGRFEAEGWRLRKDGTRFWAHVVIDPIYDEDGTFLGFAKITRDRTEQRVSTLNLEATRRTLDLALSNMSQGLCLIDADGRLQLANERFAELLDIAPGALPIGRSAHACLSAALGTAAADAFGTITCSPPCRRTARPSRRSSGPRGSSRPPPAPRRGRLGLDLHRHQRAPPLRGSHPLPRSPRSAHGPRQPGDAS
ncbi:PAS domain-containing protein [Methylorubrum suomiense]